MCKADFPKTNVLTKRTLLACHGMAKKCSLPVRGRRNALGIRQGERTDEWQSGTTPIFAVHFGSNSHTMPNYRLPPTPGVHSLLCEDARCIQQAKAMMEKLTPKKLAKIVQRVQRESTGYYCGYTFKGQAIGKKYLLQASKSFDYMTPTLEGKTATQRMHRITNRCGCFMFLVYEHCPLFLLGRREYRRNFLENFVEIRFLHFFCTCVD